MLAALAVAASVWAATLVAAPYAVTHGAPESAAFQDLERNMAPFKDRGTVFVAEETSPPREIEPGKWEVKHTARFGGSSVKMKFIYEQFDGEWLLTYAEVD